MATTVPSGLHDPFSAPPGPQKVTILSLRYSHERDDVGETDTFLKEVKLCTETRG